MRTLTQTTKIKYLSQLIERDGFVCYQCGKTLGKNDYVYEHLDDNRLHNNIENLALAHQSCNIKKANDFDMKFKAKEKLRQNEEMCLSERKAGEISGNDQYSSEISINSTNYSISEQYLTEHVQTDGSILYSDALNSIAYLCKKQTGHGSEQAVRRYLNQLTCQEAPFMIKKNDEGKRVILKRIGN